MSPEESRVRWPGCARCHHPAPLHAKGPCMARGCHSGPDGGPCPGFVPPVTNQPDPEQDQAFTDAVSDEDAADEEFADALMAAIAARRMAMLAAGAAAVVLGALAVAIAVARRRRRG
jgi:hypothetical protein